MYKSPSKELGALKGRFLPNSTLAGHVILDGNVHFFQVSGWSDKDTVVTFGPTNKMLVGYGYEDVTEDFRKSLEHSIVCFLT